MLSGIYKNLLSGKNRNKRELEIYNSGGYDGDKIWTNGSDKTSQANVGNARACNLCRRKGSGTQANLKRIGCETYCQEMHSNEEVRKDT